MDSVAKYAEAPKAFRSNDADNFTAAQVVELADKVNAHLSTLAPVSGVPLAEWDAMFDDFQSASQLLIGVANTEAFAEAFTVAHETGLTPRQLADQRDKLRAIVKDWLLVGNDMKERRAIRVRARAAIAEGGAA